jgi:hypothetical protein
MKQLETRASYGLMRPPSRCSLQQEEFMLEHPRKPTTWNTWFQTVKQGGGSVMVWAAISL